jgi:hypothetical protein
MVIEDKYVYIVYYFSSDPWRNIRMVIEGITPLHALRPLDKGTPCMV